jgi:probable phosphoglycerate mutase
VPPPVEEGAARPARDRTLVLLRHGETDWNAEGRAQGYTDVPLNALGHAQARAVAGRLAGLGASRLWSSDLMRALQTAEHIGAATGLAVEKDARLREYDLGERSGLTMAEFAAEFPERYAAWLAESEALLVPGEETTEQVRDRVVPALRDCLDALEPGTTGVLVLHGACLKVGLMALLEWPWESARSLRGMDNCGYAVVEESGRRGGLRLASYNERVGGSANFVVDAAVG